MRRIPACSLWLMLPLLFSFASTAAASDFGRDAGKPLRGQERVAIMRISPAQQTDKIIFRISVEVASDREARRKGLSGRKGLAGNRGMLFVLDKGKPSAFWMKGMRFSLDLLYFDNNGKLIKILSGLEPCADCRVYPSPEDTAYVIEVAAGTAAKYSIRTGDFFTYTDKARGERQP